MFKLAIRECPVFFILACSMIKSSCLLFSMSTIPIESPSSLMAALGLCSENLFYPSLIFKGFKFPENLSGPGLIRLLGELTIISLFTPTSPPSDFYFSYASEDWAPSEPTLSKID